MVKLFVCFNKFSLMRSKAWMEEIVVMELRIKLQLEVVESFLGLEGFSSGKHDGKSIVLLDFMVLVNGEFPKIVQFEHARNDIINLKIDLKCCYRLLIQYSIKKLQLYPQMSNCFHSFSISHIINSYLSDSSWIPLYRFMATNKTL